MQFCIRTARWSCWLSPSFSCCRKVPSTCHEYPFLLLFFLTVHDASLNTQAAFAQCLFAAYVGCACVCACVRACTLILLVLQGW